MFWVTGLQLAVRHATCALFFLKINGIGRTISTLKTKVATSAKNALFQVSNFVVWVFLRYSLVKTTAERAAPIVWVIIVPPFHIVVSIRG